MSRSTATARRVLGAAAVGAAVLVGLTLQAATVLLALPDPPAGVQEPTAAQQGEGLGYASSGTHHIGVRRFTSAEAPRPTTIWYPAAPDGEDTAVLRYSNGAAMLGERSSVALATFPGRARPGASPDLADGPYPVVILSPGFALSTSSYAWLAEHLASHGFVVAAPQHAETLDPNRLWRATVDRPRDVTATIDFLTDATNLDGRLAGLADTDRVAVVGHSYGGYTALAAAGARLDTQALRSACASDGIAGGALEFQCGALLPFLSDLAEAAGLTTVPNGRWPSWADPRVDAAVSIAGDAVMFGADGLSTMTTPLLAIGGTADPDSPLRWGTAAAYDGATGPRKAELTLVGADHFSFTGACAAPRLILEVLPSTFCESTGQDRQAAHHQVAHATTAFLLAEFLRDSTAAAVLRGGSFAPGVRFRSQGY